MQSSYFPARSIWVISGKTDQNALRKKVKRNHNNSQKRYKFKGIKGPSFYYDTTMWGILDPTPPLVTGFI